MLDLKINIRPQIKISNINRSTLEQTTIIFDQSRITITKNNITVSIYKHQIKSKST